MNNKLINNNMSGAVFDMDGLLIDTERISMTAWKKAGEMLNIPNADSIGIECIGMNGASVKALLKDRLKSEQAVHKYLSLCTEIYNEILSDGIPVKAGAKEILEYLKSNGFEIALATSTSFKRATDNMQKCGLISFFDEIVTGDSVLKGKPDPEIYLTACKKINKKPNECFAFEDSKNGILSAVTAGCKTIMIPDLWQGDEKTDKLLFAKCDTLLKALEIIS
ncbi:MAG: HAD family phosphatase [Clostridiales bacterium]|nr:HAD family phosphatase [Clostridiales bacterium]